jgi:hypothetical protein
MKVAARTGGYEELAGALLRAGTLEAEQVEATT